MSSNLLGNKRLRINTSEASSDNKRLRINTSEASSDSRLSNRLQDSIDQLRQIKKDTMELLELKDDQINHLECQLEQSEKKIRELENFRDVLSNKLDEARRDFFKESNAAKNLYNALKTATSRNVALEDRIAQAEEQLQASQATINNLEENLAEERLKTRNNIKIKICSGTNDADNIITVKRGKLSYQAHVLVEDRKSTRLNSSH